MSFLFTSAPKEINFLAILTNPLKYYEHVTYFLNIQYTLFNISHNINEYI